MNKLTNILENKVSLFSAAINQAKINGIKGVPQVPFDSLSDEEREQWIRLAEKEKKEIDSFYKNNAEQIKFSLLHKIVLLVLEELLNCQNDNIISWTRKSPCDYSDFGKVFVNYNKLAIYIWGDNNGKKIQQLKKVIDDLYTADVYMSYTVLIKRKVDNKIKKIEEYRVERLHLITTIGEKSDKLQRNRCSYIQLHQIFLRNIDKKYIRRKNFYIKLQEYYSSENKKKEIRKNVNTLPPEVTINMATYLLAKARTQKMDWTLNESTISEELQIKDFTQGHRKRGRQKITDALTALKYVGMLKNWYQMIGVEGQIQYKIIFDPVFFGNKQILDTQSINQMVENM